MAQLVACLPFKVGIMGSSPIRGTINLKIVIMEKENTDLMFNAAKTIYEYPGTDENCKVELVKMFPELEPENEKFARIVLDLPFKHEADYKFVKAYLEKLKDLTKEGIIKQLEEEFYACGTTPKWFHDTVQGAINYGRADALSKFNAVPSVVSDELRRQEIETAISQLKHLNDVYIGDEKQKEQKPAEWSDKDEKMLNLAVEMVKDSKTFASSGITKFEVAYFLKSFKDKAQSISHWKPNEEAMNRLGSIIVALRKAYCDDMADFLAELYHKLEKL